MNNIAIIPARGGSKRIPNKNIKLFLGKPIIAYSIEVARSSGLFDEIMVSTEDKSIADIAKKYGASIPFLRSQKNSDDYAALNDVYNEVISEYKKKQIYYTYSCLILPTAPLITTENLKKGYELLNNSHFDSVRPIVRFSFPIQRAFRMLSNGEVQPISNKDFQKRSQDLEPTFHDSGQFYWIRNGKDMLSNKGGFEIPENDSQDIDNETDWKLAELKHKLLFGIVK